MKLRKEKKKNYFAFIALSIVFLLLLYINISIWPERVQVEKYSLQAKEELERVITETEERESRERERNIEQEIEQIARDQLLLKKEGEQMIIISREIEEIEIEIDKEDVIEEKEEGFWNNLFNIFSR